MRVGVLVPVHGFAPYLPEALDCVLAQDGVAGVVVVDDGSPEPLALHPDHASRVRLVRRETPGGPAQARATALAHLPAGIELVALCDADDAWTPDALRWTAGALAADPAAGWAFARAQVVGPQGRPTGEAWSSPPPGRLGPSQLAGCLFAANGVPTSSVVLRRGVLEAAGGFPSPVRLAEDWELWLRLCATGAAAVSVPRVTVRYRRHAAGLTADVAALAVAQATVHTLHAALVGPEASARAVAGDHAARAAGLARTGDHAAARDAWAQVAACRPLGRAERARRAALAVPGLRRRVGRADPYR